MKPKKILTLCLVYQHPRILLGMKKRGFGAGRYNGFGGKLQEGESIEQAARRELIEEAGIEAEALEKVGDMEFDAPHFDAIMEVHVFRSTMFKGEPTESEEMKPDWFQVDEIPFKDMWADDPHWFPYFLENKKFKARFLFDENENILEKEIEEINEI